MYTNFENGPFILLLMIKNHLNPKFAKCFLGYKSTRKLYFYNINVFFVNYVFWGMQKTEILFHRSGEGYT